MKRLHTFTLAYKGGRQRWHLTEDRTGRVVKSFDSKLAATRAGVLPAVLRRTAASVRIHTISGEFQEERTYPRADDPPRSRG